ncbi:MAG TPA: hypothetical protein EYN00_00190 [Planctomycetes bacterium]|nr:hypothetical protein [Planctomycetota bacterium]
MEPRHGNRSTVSRFSWLLSLVTPLALVLVGVVAQGTLLVPDPLEVPEVASPLRWTPAPLRGWLLEQRPCGVTLALHSADPDFDYEGDLAEISTTGARWVQLKVSYYQARADSSRVAVADIHTAPSWRVRRTIRQARGLGLRVAFLPVLLLQRPGVDDWRGNIRPLDRPLWHRSYRLWMGKLAELAESEGVEILCVGSEFNSLQGDGEEWLRTITAVRERYQGAVIYSANWDSYQKIPFSEALDGMGVTAYQPLASGTEPTVAEMVSRWLPVRHQLRTWQRRERIPLLFTEIGYASIDGIAREPWDYTRDAPVDVLEQRDAYRAFLQAWDGVDELGGVFFYAWFGVGGKADRSYTPRGKPAMEVLRQWIDLWEREHR